MSNLKVEINLISIILLYLIAIIAGAVNLLLGITAFICITFFLLGLVWLIDKGRKETTG